MSKKKIDLNNVLNSLNTVCPLCTYSIPPNEMVRTGWDKRRCPKCGKEFQPNAARGV